ncbi:glutathione S-transferase family protein [Hahella ganghwensis]|uniref:glutathione S-transferase family protein n=1 Tax=Hahella ganghwensis TaxID=286420 RepID=UPI00036153B5|nr:glutathione S-transferase family protein [Hahella ganghwensis]
MKAYLVYGSPNCRKVLATIQHLQLDVEIEYLEFDKGDLMTPEYTALNPNRKVPVLVDGDFRLWESNAICQYLACQYGSGELFSGSPQERANITRWLFWEMAHFNLASGTILMETFFKPLFMGASGDPAKIAEGKERFAIYAQILDDQLAQTPFVAGDKLTIADFAVASQSDHWDAGDVPYQPYKNIIQWLERLNCVESWNSTAQINEKMLEAVAEAD